MKYCNQCRRSTKEDSMNEYCGTCKWDYRNKRQ